MISQQATLMRMNKIGKPYVQSQDPSITNSLAVNDLWLNPEAGTMKIWDGTGWNDMQFGESVFMDNCISNRMIANDISASKIVVGILKSQDEAFYLNLETGEAKLLRLEMGGQVEGNIIATSSNGLTRVRLRGREGEKNVTAGVIFEQREEVTPDDDTWENAGQIYFAYNSQQSFSAVQNYQIGAYDGNRPSQGYNAGVSDGLVWRPMSQDWLQAAYATYHGYRLMKRATRNDSFAQVPAVCTAIGNCMEGSSVVCNGIVTVTYQINEIARIDFQLSITTAGSSNTNYGISRALLRTLNADIPLITPVDGGVLHIFSSAGALATTVGATFLANGNYWTPARIDSGVITALNENNFTAGRIITGTCFGNYSLE